MSERLMKMVSDLYAGLRALEDAVREEPEPTQVKQPATFEHTDPDGDDLHVRETMPESHQVLYARVSKRLSVYLDQDAVNRLAQYLDGYRTDLPKAVAGPEYREHWCGSDSDHVEHVHGQSERMRCLGSYRGYYGVAEDMT